MESQTLKAPAWVRFKAAARRRLDLTMVIALTVLSFMVFLASVGITQTRSSTLQIDTIEQLEISAKELQAKVDRSGEITTCLRQLDSNVTTGISKWQTAVTNWLSATPEDRPKANQALKDTATASAVAAQVKESYADHPTLPCPT